VQVLVHDFAVERLQCAERPANSYLAVDNRGDSTDFSFSQFIKCLSLHFECEIRLHWYRLRIIGRENMTTWIVLEVNNHDLVLVSHLISHNFV